MAEKKATAKKAAAPKAAAEKKAAPVKKAAVKKAAAPKAAAKATFVVNAENAGLGWLFKEGKLANDAEKVTLA